MAEYLSIGPVDPNTALWVRDAARQEKLPEIKDLNNPKYFPYRWGQALWAYIGGPIGRAGDRRAADDRGGARATSMRRSSTCWAIKSEDLSNRVARRRSSGHTATCSPTPAAPDRDRTAGDRRQGAWSGAERRAVDQSRRPVDRVPLDEEPVLDRPVSRRSRDRTDRSQADEHGHRSARLEHSVHPLGGRLGQREPADCGRHRGVGTRGSGDLRRAERLAHARDSGTGRRRDPEPDLGAGRQGRRVHRHAARSHRSVHLRPVGGNAPPPDQRRVRRGAAGVVARRPPHRVRDRSLHERSRHAGDRPVPTGPHRPRTPARSKRCADSPTPSTSTRNGRRTARRCTSSPIAGACPTSIEWALGAQAAAGHGAVDDARRPA